MKPITHWWSVATVMLLVFGLSLSGAQGPRRDIGRNVPVPPLASPASSVNSVNEDTRADFVSVDVVVTSADGLPISGLTQDQFKLLVDGEEQTIENFQEVDEPVTVTLLIEFGALSNRSIFNPSVIVEDRVLVPAEGFLKSLQVEDWASIVGYDRRPWIDSAFTQNKAFLIDRIRNWRRPRIDAQGAAFYDAVAVTLDRMDSVWGTKAIVLLSSGLDTSSEHNYGELLKIAERSDTVIYAVGMSEQALLLARTENMTINQARNSLRSVAEGTDGISFFPKVEAEYGGVLNGIDLHLRFRYRLDFVTNEVEQSGDLHEIGVEIVPGPSVPAPDSITLHHRKGFYF